MRFAASDVEEEVVPGSGYWITEENPKAIVVLIRAFLDRTDHPGTIAGSLSSAYADFRAISQYGHSAVWIGGGKCAVRRVWFIETRATSGSAAERLHQPVRPAEHGDRIGEIQDVAVTQPDGAQGRRIGGSEC